MNEYFKKHKVHLMAWVFFAVLKTIAAVLFALYMQKMIDAVSAMDAQKMLHTSIAGVVIVVCYAAFGYVGSYFEMKFSQKVLVDVRQDICKSIVSTDLDSYRLHKSAEYTSILNNDIGMLDEKYFLCLPNIVIQILTFLIATVTLYQMEPWLAFSAILLCAVPLIVPFLFGKQISARQKSYIHVLDWYNGKTSGTAMRSSRAIMWSGRSLPIMKNVTGKWKGRIFPFAIRRTCQEASPAGSVS